MCFYKLPPVHELYPNYKVVVLQPWTVTPTHLGSVSIVTKFISSPPIPPDYTIFVDCSFPSYILLPPYQQLFIIVAFSLFSPSSHFLSWCEAPPTWMLLVPDNCQPPPLVSAPRAACLHLLTFTLTLRPHPLPPTAWSQVAVTLGREVRCMRARGNDCRSWSAC